MTILVTGIRGNIGSRVAALLTQAGHDVRGTARTPDGLPAPDGVELMELDIDAPRTADAALDGVDTIFLYPTRGNSEEFLASARKHDVRHVVQLSSPAAFEAGDREQAIGLLHRAAEDRVERSGLPHTHIYPSWLATNAVRDWAPQIRAEGRIGLAYPGAQINPVHIDDVAEVVVELLTRDRHRARWQILTGPAVLRVRDAIAAIGRAVGRDIHIDELSRAAALASRRHAMPEHVLQILLDGDAAAVDTPPLLTNSVERITGHRPRTFDDWIRTHRESFLP